MSKKVSAGVVSVAVSGLLAAGCGGDSGDSATDLPTLEGASATTEAADGAGEAREIDADEAFARFDACMADEGFEVSESSGGVDVPTEPDDFANDGTEVDFEAAQEKCDPILDEAFGDLDLAPEQQAELDDALLALQRCMDEAGYDEIDLTSDVFELPDGVDLAAFDEALERCEEQAAPDLFANDKSVESEG